MWSMEKFENKIVDMRDMYEERKEKGLPLMVEENEEEESSLYLTGPWVCFLFSCLSFSVFNFFFRRAF